MATTLSAQLQAIKSFVQGETEPLKRPFTRPSVLFDPKEAADIDVETILSIAVAGLESLAGLNSRFSQFKETLFSRKSCETDRETMGIEENTKLDISISAYLRLLSGYLHVPPALKTLEYLIRRYKVHVYNVDELVLSALPYHDTHAFVRIIQLLDLQGKNKIWGFLEGVKSSGAPPPRKVIVQQCIRDMGVLEMICNYAIPTKKFQPSKEVICFCTAVIVEVLGSVPSPDDGFVKRILPFVFDGLNPAQKAELSDSKAGSMMVVALLANRATLASKLINNLIFFIARVAYQDATQSADLPWLRLCLMAIVSLVQSQTIQVFPKKGLDFLASIRDLSGVLAGLSKEFNIERFLRVYIEALAENSFDDSLCNALVSTIENVPMKNFVSIIINKVLLSCLKLSQKTQKSSLHEAGKRARQILGAISKCYPDELRGAFRKFLEDPKVCLKQDSIFEVLCSMFDGSIDMPPEISYSKLWFHLEHPKAEVRRSALSTIAASGLLRGNLLGSQNHGNVQEAILQRLHDDDLSVVQASLVLEDLCRIIKPPLLVHAFQDILMRCVDIQISNHSPDSSRKACDVAISCLECAISNFRQHLGDYSKEIATMVFPLLLIIPKTWKLNIKALELVKEIAWPFYSSLYDTYNSVPTSFLKELKREHLASVNAKTVEALARSFLTNVEGYVPWLIECCKTHKLSKTLFFLIIQQSFTLNQKEEAGHFLLLFQACFPMLQNEWHLMESQEDTLTKELKNEKIEETCKGLIDHLFDGKFSALNSNILICLFWSILEGATSQITVQGTMVGNRDTLQIVDDLFVFFAMSSLKNVLLEQLQRLVMKNNVPSIEFLYKFFTEDGFSPVIQEASLSFLATSCSSATLSKSSGATTSIQLLLGFPTLLIPLASDNQDVRVAAMNCIECLFNLSNHIGNSNLKNGNEALSLSAWIPAFGDLLGMIKEQRKLILSDAKFLLSYLTSVLSSFNQSLLVPQNADKWFDQQTKEAVVHFILSSALNLAAPGKLKLLSLFREMGNTILNVAEVKMFLSELLERRKRSHIDHDKSSLKLAAVEVEMLCLLLEICLDVRSSSSLEDSTVVYLFKALQVDGLSSEDPAVIKPCATVLQNLSARFYDDLTDKLQDDLFCQLLILFRTEHGVIQNVTKDALLRINVNCSSIIQLLDMILSLQHCQLASPDTRVKKKKSAKHQNSDLGLSLFSKELAKLPFLSSFLDVLLLKKDMESRSSLVEPLFRLLAKVFDDEWFSGVVDQNGQSSLDTVGYIQQTVLLILEEIVASLSSHLPVKAKMLDKFNVDLLVACARSAKDVTTRNHVFLLLSSVSKIIPDQVLDHILDIFTVVGEAAVTQSDGHSQHVFEELMSAVVPCWLSRTGKPEGLLQIFVNLLPEITEHRRLGLMVYLLRTLGEKHSLGLLFVLLLRSLVQRTTRSKANGETYFLTSHSSAIFGEWEFLFAIQLCEQYSCITWLPSLVMLLQEIGGPESQEQVAESLVAMQFVQHKLLDTELVFKLESGQEKIVLEGILGTLLEQVVYHYQSVAFKRKQLKVPSIVRRELKDCIQSTLRTITLSMGPSVFFKAITKLLDSLDNNVRKKALSLLCETLKNHIIGQRHRKESRKPDRNPSSFRFSMDAAAWESFDRMCLGIIQLFAASNLDSSVKLAGLSALEIVANQLPSNSSVYITCLASVAKDILSDNLAVSSGCLRTTAALISALGPKALSELPHIMGHVLERARRVSSVPAKKVKHGSDEALGEVSNYKESILVAILMTLDAIIEKLGGFLNPYLKDIVELMVLHLEHYSETCLKVKQRAEAVRRLLIEKIPVRLILTPLLKVYPEALKQGEQSLAEVFTMLANAIGRMDRSSVRSYHAMIFDQCLMALDLRGQHQASIKDVNIVEENVIHAMSVLTMKLTETMFRPLFVRTLEWTEAEPERNGANSMTNLDRNISFYKLINKLAEQQRSLFVPYFKYLLESCTRYLTDDEVSDFSQKRKKPKLQLSNYGTEKTGTLSISQWQLRTLVLLALYKCFLYDIGNIKFLDSTNFQVLLKPIVSQLIAEPPATLEQFPNIPSVKEVDDILVLCLCQMGVTAGTDVLWKPLNQEVLMQTRSEKVRSRILGLRVVKCLVERLKEEYLIFLAETIPFLAELLEDVELPVKSLAQEILKELETLSGENIKEYL